jgi:hypothetical protein
MRSPSALLLSITVGLLADAQTAIDLRTQGKNVDFTGSNSTKPFKSGGTLPVTCSVGEVFFKTNAPAGSNFYGCTSLNSWTLQSGQSGGVTTLAGDVNGPSNSNIVTQIQGRAVSATAPADTQALMWNAASNRWLPQTVTGGGGAQPSGIVVVCVTDPINNTCVPAINTSVVLTIPRAQSGNAIYCHSTNGTPAYSCTLSAASVLNSYTVGMMLLLHVDATCSSSCTLNVDGVGVRSIRKIDGTTDPGGALAANQPQLVFYNGTVFLLMR